MLKNNYMAVQTYNQKSCIYICIYTYIDYSLIFEFLPKQKTKTDTEFASPTPPGRSKCNATCRLQAQDKHDQHTHCEPWCLFPYISFKSNIRCVYYPDSKQYFIFTHTIYNGKQYPDHTYMSV